MAQEIVPSNKSEATSFNVPESKRSSNMSNSPIPPTDSGNGEKKEEGSTGSMRNSPVPSVSSTTSSSKRSSHQQPITMTNSVPNRPPSTTSVHSSNSAAGSGPRSTTAMSRRGGRTRSRSPPMMIQRPPSVPNTGPPQPPEGYTAPAGGDERGGPAPPSPANPSAAAAAAAAAAKSIARNAPPPGSWYDGSDADREREFRRSRAAAPATDSVGPPGEAATSSRSSAGRYRYYEGGPVPPPHSSRHKNWPPPEEGGRPSSRSRYPPSQRQGGEDYYGYRENGGYPYRSTGARSSRGGEPYPPPYDEEYDRRYPEYRYEDRGHRSNTSPRPPPSGYSEYRGGRDHHHHHPHPDDPYYKQHQQHPKELDGRHEHLNGGPMVKRTTRVIGTATPIHMPRAPEPGPPSSRGRSSSGSIFRGRPGAEVVRKPHVNKEEDNSQKILMALRTPSTSFEEKPKEGTATKRNGDPLSPEAPPQIHHSHHQSSTDSNLFFEPQRSPKSVAGPPQHTNSLDMAPSFTLFNQSFDSIGDTANFFSVSGPLDSTLQSTSFGAALAASDTLTGSEEKEELQLTASNGNFSQQILGGSSSGGALTFGMSPSNSFGNGPPSSRSGNMMVLGGQDNRPSSPSQVLDMYRSYSSGGGVGSKPSPEDGHLRGPIGAGGQSLPTSYTKSFGEASRGQHQYRVPPTHGHPESTDGTPGFYIFLKQHKDAFKECSFLLPGLKAALLQAPDVKEEPEDTPKRHTRNDPYGEPNPHEITIALRRVASAVCAFGGTFVGDRNPASAPPTGKSNSSQSIFREKPVESATVTPNSSTSTSPGSHRSRQRAKYDEMLPSRYYENDNRLSWEFEENPPIDDMGKEEEEEAEAEAENTKKEEEQGDGAEANPDSKSKNEGEKEEDDEGDEDNMTANGSKDGDQPKMRYRCKLCGQPKQNHTCPYQQSLARSIGAMVYPAVNAFTSDEPGVLAPPLSDMNNFVLHGSESVSSSDASPSRPTPDRHRRFNHNISSSAQVTPESMRSSPRGMATPVTTPQRSSRTPGSSHRPPSRSDMHGRRYLGGPPSVTSSSAPRGHQKKRSYRLMMTGGGPDDQGDLLFVDAVDLKPEQFRMVTSSKIVSSPDAFTYPALPLPYAQRKRLSDNLFSLSKEVPQLTDECAAVLREAREKDMWDLAVAELMTQVVVVVHCHDGDSRFEGLRRYLLTLGISC